MKQIWTGLLYQRVAYKRRHTEHLLSYYIFPLFNFQLFYIIAFCCKKLVLQFKVSESLCSKEREDIIHTLNSKGTKFGSNRIGAWYSREWKKIKLSKGDSPEYSVQNRIYCHVSKLYGKVRAKKQKPIRVFHTDFSA